MHVIFAANGRC